MSAVMTVAPFGLTTVTSAHRALVSPATSLGPPGLDFCQQLGTTGLASHGTTPRVVRAGPSFDRHVQFEGVEVDGDGIREVNVVDVKEVLRAWLDGVGLRMVAAPAGVDRKTARRYVQVAQEAGLERSAGFAAVTDDVVAAVVSAVRPGHPNGHGTAWEALEARHA